MILDAPRWRRGVSLSPEMPRKVTTKLGDSLARGVVFLGGIFHFFLRIGTCQSDLKFRSWCLQVSSFAAPVIWDIFFGIGMGRLFLNPSF